MNCTDNKYKYHSIKIFNIGQYKNKNIIVIDMVKDNKQYCEWFLKNYKYKDNLNYIALQYVFNKYYNK